MRLTPKPAHGYITQSEDLNTAREVSVSIRDDRGAVVGRHPDTLHRAWWPLVRPSGAYPQTGEVWCVCGDPQKGFLLRVTEIGEHGAHASVLIGSHIETE